MTVKQRLHQHLAELERGEAFSHERMKDMAELIDKLAAPALPVVHLEDAELQNNEEYAILFKNEWMETAEWCYKAVWHNGLGFYDPDDDGSYIDIAWVTHVIEQSIVDDFLNAPIPLEVGS